jgi:hypothetical protein
MEQNNYNSYQILKYKLLGIKIRINISVYSINILAYK